MCGVCVHMFTKLLQLCLTLCQPMDCSPPDALVHRILYEIYWSGLPCPPPVNLLDSVTKPMSLMSPALADGFFTTSATWKALTCKGIPTKLSTDFSEETIQARRKSQDIFKVMKIKKKKKQHQQQENTQSKSLQPRLHCRTRVSFRFNEEIRSFTGK